MRRQFLWLGGAAIVAVLVLQLEAPLVVKAVAVGVLGGLIPGALLVQILVGAGTAPPSLLERVLYALGAGYASLVVVLLAASYLPGGLLAWQLYAGIGILVAILTILAWQQTRQSSGVPMASSDDILAFPDAQIPRSQWPWIAIALLVVLAVTGFLRLTSLGYAEFHGDEARSVLRAAAVIQGYEDVLFLHRKAPAEILVPAAVFSLAGRLDEASARVLFTVANLGALAGVFLLGWRMFGSVAGFAAALLLAVDGYFIAFSRFVQYQSIVLLLSVLVVMIAYRVYRHPRALTGYLTLAAILVATGLLCHYDALLALLPAGFLLAAAVWTRRVPWQQMLRALAPGLIAGTGIVALFYAPFMAHPNFQSTLHYLWSGRIHGRLDFPYNNLSDFFLRSSIYSSTYYVVLMIMLAVAALLLAYHRGLRWPWNLLAGSAVVAVVAVTFWRADWLKVGKTDFTFVPFTLAIAGVWFLPRLSSAERSLWLWFGAPLLAAMFFIVGPKTHVHIFFIPWALLAGSVIGRSWHWLTARYGWRPALLIGVPATALFLTAFGGYTYFLFVYHNTEILLNWNENQPPGYWSPDSIPELDSFYGFPLTNGWKVAGALYNDGVIDGNYETNQSFDWISAWYTRGQTRCDSTADWYFAIDGLEPWIPHASAVTDSVEGQGFARWGDVAVSGAPRMRIYTRANGEDGTTPGLLALEEYAAAFDAAATPDLPLSYPTVESKPSQTFGVNLDNQVRLEGYDLTYTPPLRPGDPVQLTLYWRALQPLAYSYKVFNQSYYGDGVMVAQQDSLPVCNRHPTLAWRPGELVIDTHTLTVNADVPAGVYPLFTGLYREETQERLAVLDEAGNPVSNQIQVGELKVED